MKFKKILIVALLSIFLLPVLAFALNFEVGEEIFLMETINDDYYAAGGMVQLESDVNGDMVAAGGRLFIDSVISQDLTLAGGDIIVRGEVQDDARIVGGNITIGSLIKDDLMIGGGNIEITESGYVAGDLIVGGGNIAINGRINGDIIGAGGNLYINNTVRGNVSLVGIEKVRFGPKGKVLGDFSYRSPKMSTHVNKETIKGKIQYEPTEIIVEYADFQGLAWGILAGFSIFHLLALLFIGLFFVWIFHFFMLHCAKTGYKYPLKSFGMGFLILALTPIAAILVLVTGIGLPLSFILILMWLLAIFFGKLIAISMIGIKIFRIKEKSGFWKIYGTFAFGALIYVATGLIPIIGWIIKFILVLLGVGAFVLYEKKLFNLLHKEKKV